MNCKECKFEAHQLSRENQRALDAIRDQLSLDPIKQVWTASYPCQLDPSLLHNNKSQAVLLAEKTEKRLLKDATDAENFNEQFLEFIDKGILTRITPEEEASYQGPVYYVNAHEVYKPDSTSTPIRIVINSSLKYKGLSPNDIWVKGPNTLNDMYGILLRLRFHRYALIGDIKKMYTNIRTTEKEKHMRRVLWRFTNTKDEFITYAVDRVMFGDRPAAAVTSVAIRQTANIYKNISEEASQKIINDTYVDDVTTGTDIKENIPALKRDISAILEKGGMEMKGFVASGDSSPELVSLLGSGEASRVLGVQYDPESDTFSVIVRINISKKYRGVRAAPDLTYEQIPQLLTIVFTRRICQGIVYSCYDVYGLVTPITIPLKIELRNLFSKELNLGWDDPLPDVIRKRWITILQIAKSVEHIPFWRNVKPDAPVVGKPTLIVCNDASTEAMCATAHIRWQLEDGTFQCFLYSSKTRVAPLQKESVPRLEMQSAVMAVRLSKSIITHTNIDFEEITHVLDSKCTLATLLKDTVALKEYMGTC